ncbi:hypothetical protein PPL_12467 [Heterostelium album PN500]|uniref:Uncharacterized protein n=1 Tax=Heterostelium pallidum (strain ATCC 26659 / Pp 5 / PN500) TaxID=670386 RepID=D3BMP4_HETP5|nr:hypothetical protein PPL_12467 [Heterostelium album PN500]EFA77256.1 hypothetical protein PPL_12467 [Heterostelium album PN500]|eukprot:XP_020429385.1 hypothetical protein PPL_12467 [Heterostelium album PN500]
MASTLIFNGRVDGYELNYKSDGSATYTLNGALLWKQQWMTAWSDYIMFKTSDNRICLLSYMDINGFLSGDILTNTGFTPLLRTSMDQNLDFKYLSEFSDKKDVVIALNKTGGRKFYTINLTGSTITEFTPSFSVTSELFKKSMDLEKRLSRLENSRVTTQIVKVATHGNVVNSTDWVTIAGSQASVVINVPSKVVAIVQYHSLVTGNLSGTYSIDVTSALNGNLMTNGGMNNAWPVGSSISQCSAWNNGVSVTSDILQPGIYNYEMKAKLRFTPPGGVGSVNGPGAVIFIMPL